MPKKIIFTSILMLTLGCYLIFPGEVGVKISVKFRGTVNLAVSYMFGVHDGITDAPHAAYVSYNPLDLTGKTDGRIIGNTWGEIKPKLFINYAFVFPLKFPEHQIFSDASVRITVLSQVSPISLNGGISASFKPLAFLVLETGFMFGSGWPAGSLSNGLGRNMGGRILREAFYGPVFQAWFSMLLQFDTAFLVPAQYKKWSHAIILVKPYFQYKALLNIPSDRPFIWEADRGENMNGWNFLMDLLLGYQFIFRDDGSVEDGMFIRMKNLNFKLLLGIMGSIDAVPLSHFKDSQMKDGWGSDFFFFEFGPMLKFDLPYNLFATALLLWKNDRSYTPDTVQYAYFKDRRYSDWYVYLRRLIISFGWNF